MEINGWAFIDACRYMSQVSNVAFPEGSVPQIQPEATPLLGTAAAVATAPHDRPQIILNGRQMDTIINDAWQAIDSANAKGPHEPVLFIRGSMLVRVMAPESSTFSEAVPTIRDLDESTLLGFLYRNASWFRSTDAGKYPAAPSPSIASDMMRFISPMVPPLETVATTPMFAKSGVLIEKPGYHANAAVYYEPAQGFEVPTVPRSPTESQVLEARDCIMNDLLVDFPFVTSADKAHAVAAMFLPVVRRMITGPTPLHLIEAPCPGSGKGLLTSAISIAATGEAIEVRSLSGQEEERRKMITSELATARQLIILDNASEKRRLDSPPLASVLTSTRWSDRVLGKSEMVNLPNYATWILTGNNPKLSNEITRRCIRIKIDPQTDQPWRRSETDFQHPQLLQWAMQNRARLVYSILVLVTNWIAQGQPSWTKSRLGSFEGWSSVIGGILYTSGIEGFLKNMDEMLENADEESQEWRAFVARWWKEHRDTGLQTSILNKMCDDHNLMFLARGDGNLRSQQIRLGRELSRKVGRVFDGKRITSKLNNRDKVTMYALVKTNPNEPDDDDFLPG